MKLPEPIKKLWTWCGDNRTTGVFHALTAIAALIGLWVSIVTAMNAIEQNKQINQPNIKADFAEEYRKFRIGNIGPSAAANLRGEILSLHVDGGEIKSFREPLKFGWQKFQMYDSESFSTGFDSADIQQIKSGTVFLIAKICAENMREPYVRISYKNMNDKWDWKKSDGLMYSLGDDQKKLLKPFLKMDECE